MKFRFTFLVLSAGALLMGCSNIDRSRNLADPKVSAVTMAQQVCSLCHGLEGQSVNPSFPNLAGQQQTYFIAQMKEFRGHNRLDPAGYEYMWGLSRSVTDEQIEGLAAYYSAMASRRPPGKTEPAQVAKGRAIYESGVPDKGIPACAGCHGAAGQGNEQFPRVAHQHEDYLFKQLTVFQRTDERPEGSIMKTVAHELTRENMKDVAAFLQGLSTPTP
jgi:cytochrome c553